MYFRRSFLLISPLFITHLKPTLLPTQVYTEPNEWNCVATCFFIDCAPNVIEFIESIYNILQPGGVWINLGPLLYHYR